MKPKKLKVLNAYEILNEDFVEWIVRKEMFYILEDPGTPDDIERAATLIYNWYSTHDAHIPTNETEWKAAMTASQFRKLLQEEKQSPHKPKRNG